MTLTTFLFWAAAAMTSLAAVAVVVSQNIVRAAIWLLFSLAGTSGIFFLLGSDFVAATQLLVYVGGTLVLVIFGVMLTAQGPFISMRTGAAEWAISGIVGLLLLSVLVVTILSFKTDVPNAVVAVGAAPVVKPPPNPERSLNTMQSGLGLLGIENGPEHKVTRESGNTRRTAYLLPFEIVSVHLLVVLIGAAYLARAKRRRGARA